MSGAVISAALLGAVILGGVLRERLEARGALVGFRLALGLASVGLAAGALWGNVPGGPLMAALWVAGGMLAAAAPLDRAPLASQLSGLTMAMGPLLAGVMLDVPRPTGAQIIDTTHVGLALVVGALLSLGLGFGLRAAERLAQGRQEGDLGTWAIPLAAAAVAGLAFRRLAAPGPDPMTLWLPVVGSDGHPILWIANVGQGIPATAGYEQPGLLLLAGAATCLGAAFIPARKPAAAASVLGGALLLGAVAWLFSFDGAAIDLTAQSEIISQTVARVGIPEATAGGQARISGTPPASVSLALVAPALAMLIAAGVAAVGAGASRFINAPPQREPMEALAHRLAARDAFQLATVVTWLGVGAWFFLTHHQTGLWGPNSAADHLISGGAVGMAALLMAMHAMGGRQGAVERFGRPAAVALGLGLLVAVAAGGLVSAVGLFELP